MKSGEEDTLTDSAYLVLSLSDDSGTFLRRQLDCSLTRLSDVKDYVRFVNLDSVWYGIREKGNGEGSKLHEIEFVESMNDSPKDMTMLGCDPFVDMPV